jgi:hypothetical protein
MTVTNHFDVRWVDGYSAVSDVPSSLAAVIEKLAAELPSSGDRIELAVRDVRRSDGTTTWVGLLRFVVAVSSAPRPLGFLHAAVLPAGHLIDLEGWRTVVERRYGDHPEERIRTLYEELAESTKDIGRIQLHALSIRMDDVRDLLVPFDDDTPPAIPRTYTRPGSRPPKGTKSMPPGVAASAPAKRTSQPVLPLSVRVVNLPEDSPGPAGVDDLRTDTEPDLANDTTQPMPAPSGTAAPLSGEHPQHLPVKKQSRTWWLAGVGGGALVILLGAVGWLAHQHVVLVGERNRLEDELAQRPPDRDAWDRDRAELERVKRELEDRKAADKTCTLQIEAETRKCDESLKDARSLNRVHLDRVDQLEETVRLKDSQLEAAIKSNAKLKSEITPLTVRADDAERRERETEADNKQLRAKLSDREKLLSTLSKCLQSVRGGEKPPPKECQGIK